MNQYALIVAGGQGSRMQSSIPKQFLEVNGKPILLYTLEAFQCFNSKIKIVLVLPEEQIVQWNRMIDKYEIKIDHKVVMGGETRFHSVKNGILAIEGPGLVAIHDGVRPLVSSEIIGAGFEMAAKYGNAVTTVDLKDSIRKKTKDSSEYADRSEFQFVQTPQTFDIDLIQKAYQQTYDEIFTDDASVFERAGHAIQLVKGSYNNIKITTQEDLIVASALLSQTKKA